MWIAMQNFDIGESHFRGRNLMDKMSNFPLSFPNPNLINLRIDSISEFLFLLKRGMFALDFFLICHWPTLTSCSKPSKPLSQTISSLGSISHQIHIEKHSWNPSRPIFSKWKWRAEIRLWFAYQEKTCHKVDVRRPTRLYFHPKVHPFFFQ